MKGESICSQNSHASTKKQSPEPSMFQNLGIFKAKPPARIVDQCSRQNWRRTEEAHSPLARTEAQLSAAGGPFRRCLK